MTNSSERIHGGRVFEAAEALGRHWSEIIDFSANINPLGQPGGLKEAIFRDFERSLHYPEARAESLSFRLAEMTGLTAGHFMAGAGSTPHLHLLPRALGLNRPVIIGPAFAEYEGALTRSGLTSQYVLTREDDDWLVTRETLNRVFNANPDSVFLAHPANPTGRLVPGDILEELAAECLRRNIWLVLDEAFIDFTENSLTLLPLVAANTRLVVLRSLTKIFALPGLRLAFLAAHPRVMAALTPLVEPWPLSSQAISAGHYCLSRPGFKVESLAAVKDYRNRQLKAVGPLGLGRIYPSEANFMLLKLREGIDGRALIEHLFAAGVLVRDAANFNGLCPGFIRLAVRPPDEVAALVKGLGSFLTRPAEVNLREALTNALSASRASRP